MGVVLWLSQRSKALVIVHITYTTAVTTAMVYGSYTLWYNSHIPKAGEKEHNIAQVGA